MQPLVNILIAYPYFSDKVKTILEKATGKYHLIVDSGAFSAWNSGKEIKLDEYCKFLDTLPKTMSYKAVQLDVIGDGEKSYTNLMKMREDGYDPIPVFTRGESLERLDELYSLTDYVMLGGVAKGGTNKNYVKWFLENNKNRKAHLLGFTRIPFILKYKPYSVDSSSWASAVRYGSMSVYVGSGKMKRYKKQDFIEHPSQERLQTLYSMGFTFDEVARLRTKEAWINRASYSKNTVSAFSQFVTLVACVMQAIWVERTCGTKIYFAVSDHNQAEGLIEAHDFVLSNIYQQRIFS